MNSIANCQLSQDTLILSSQSDEKYSSHGKHSPTEQNEDSQPSNSMVELPFQFFVVSPKKAMLPQKCFFAAIRSKMGSA